MTKNAREIKLVSSRFGLDKRTRATPIQTVDLGSQFLLVGTLEVVCQGDVEGNFEQSAIE